MTQGFQENNVKMPSNNNEKPIFIVEMVYCMYVGMSVRHHFKDDQYLLVGFIDPYNHTYSESL